MRTAVLLLALWLAGCASVGTAFDWDKAREVKVGTTEAELVALLGKPNSVVNHGNNQSWTWVHVSSSVFTGAESRRVTFPLKDGKVTALPNLASF